MATVSLDCSRLSVKTIRICDLRDDAAGYPTPAVPLLSVFLETRVSSLSYFRVERVLCLNVLFRAPSVSRHMKGLAPHSLFQAPIPLANTPQRAHAQLNCQSFVLFMVSPDDHR